MAVDNSAKNGGVKTELDLYGDDDNYDHLHQEEGNVGDILDDYKQEDEDALLGRNENEGIMGDMGEHIGGEMEEHHVGEMEDDIPGVDRRQSEADDLLYDAVITDRTSPGVGRHSHDENGGDSSSPSPGLRLSTGGMGSNAIVTGSGTMHQAQRKNSCYVGNLTWWTTDQDLTEAVTSIGISDVIDVKFYENRANGQSKGFALVSFDTEASVRRCMENLPSKQIHAQVPVVMPYTKQSLAQFEAATRKPGERPEGSQGGSGTPVAMQPTTPTGRAPPAVLPPATGMKPGNAMQDKNAPTFLGVLRIGGGGSRPMGPGPGGMGAPAQTGVHPLAAAAAAAAAAAVARSSMGLPPGPPGVVMRGGPMHAGMPGLPPPGSALGFPGGGRPHGGMGGQMPPQNIHGMGPPPMMSRPPPPGMMGGGPPGGMFRGMPPGMQGAGQYGGAPMMAGHPPGGMPPPGVPPPGSHVNPNFYPGLAAAHQQQQQAAGGHHDVGGVLNEAEFEEIMNRNRTVSSSAISRAVSDAAAGDYASAIETLVTALSLIRQSKVAHDDRCKVLIGSLQDTLHGIEAKSYGNAGAVASGGGGSHHGGSSGSGSRRSKDRGSGRDRSRSRDRPGGGGGERKRRHRSRSRSRSRDRYNDDYSPRRSRRY